MRRNIVKRFAKVTACILAACCSLFAATACRRGASLDLDDSKMHLWVGVYDAGGGTEWLEKAISRFEAEYSDYYFGNGKVGLDIHIDPSRKYSGDSMDNDIERLNGEVIFAEGSPAVYIANSGYALDIDDVVKADVGKNFITGAEDRQGYSIADMLNAEQKEYLLATEGNRYFTLPTNEIFFNIIYDLDLFDEEQLYFNTAGNLICDDPSNDRRSSGADGNQATEYDNGLPATYDEFFQLCDKIVELDMQPVTWGGTVSDYISSFLLCMSADYHGVGETRLNYDYNGTLTDYIAGFENGQPVFGEKPVDISVDNGYELYRQSGRYHTLKFLERLLKTSTVRDGKSVEKYVDKSEVYSTAFTHTAAQTRFVSSKNSKTKKRVAMLIDGTWWQNEAKLALRDSEGSDEAARLRKFGAMPIPKVDRNRLREQTLLQLTGQTAFIKRTIDPAKTAIAKEFLKFCFTKESLTEYTQTTSMVRPYAFNMREEDYQSLTAWGKNLYDLHTDAKKVYQDSASEIAKYYSSELWHSKNLWNATIDGEGYTFPSTALKYGSVVTAETYFTGLQNYWTEETWRSTFSFVVTPEK